MLAESELLLWQAGMCIPRAQLYSFSQSGEGLENGGATRSGMSVCTNRLRYATAGSRQCNLLIYAGHQSLDPSCPFLGQKAASEVGMSLTFALQALLVRHETYIVEAEEERSRMAANINKLEIENKQLETANAQVIEENRSLLNQLENLNNTVTESSSEIQSLTATLDATRQELQRITILAGRAAHLEQQLSALEIEQEQLHQELATTKDDERSAVRRWKQAERTFNGLQEQMDKIDREAREERERYAEVLERMERQRAVETELESASSTSKSAAAASGSRNGKKGGSVVSHFVTDILQDNANLQLGIVELREMLLTSNEEVESLRECMTLHQPVVSDNEDGSQKPNLRRELGLETTENSAPELHVHHHYYPTEKPEPSSKHRLPLYRRPRKKRNIVTPNTITSHHGSRTPRTPTSYSESFTPTSAAATILSHTSVTVPSSTRPTSVNHWSRQSDQTLSSCALSSVPSSPQSAFRDTFFDRNDITMDSSRPTSPDSTFPESPMSLARHKKRLDETPLRSHSTPVAFQLKARASWTIPGKSTPTLQHSKHTDLPQPGTSHGRILQGNERSNSPPDTSLPDLSSETSTDDPISPVPARRSHALHRSTSHESLLSISGMDIHTRNPTLRSQLSRPHPFPVRLTLTRHTPTTTLPPSKPILSATTTTAIATAHTKHPHANAHSNRSLLSNIADTATTEKQTLGKRLGGWVFGKWGVAPVAASSMATAPGREIGNGLGRSSAREALVAVEERAVGGAGKGLGGGGGDGGKGKEKDVGSRGSGVRARNVDRELLRETLVEGEMGLG